jgi:lipoprotein NlpD
MPPAFLESIPNWHSIKSMKHRQTPTGSILRKLGVFLSGGLLVTAPIAGGVGPDEVAAALQLAHATGSHAAKPPSPSNRSPSRTGARTVDGRDAPPSSKASTIHPRASSKASATHPRGTGKHRSATTGKAKPRAADARKTAQSAADKRSDRQQKNNRPPADAIPRGPAWRWPMDGRVVTGFNPGTPGRKGIRLSGAAGQTVRAAAAGTVIYVGKNLPGYGRLIVLQHGPAWVSAYGYLGGLLVGEGTRVRAGQPIARLGAGRQGRPGLHFELRRQGKPVNPLSLLPRR